MADRGRPSTYTPEAAAEIIQRLSAGEPLATICKDDHMPAVRTVSDWKMAHDDFSANFARARDEGHDAIAAECKTIADTPMVGERTEMDANGKVERIIKEDMLGHRKLQIETRLKLLAKWDPRRYGEKVAIGGAGDLPPIQQESTLDVSSLSPEQLLALASIRLKGD